MMKLSRQVGEQWADWHVRSMRRARLALYQADIPRWSTFILQQIWGLAGHVSRGEPIAARMQRWRDLQWWRIEQSIPPSWGGRRHAHRFNPHVDIERQIIAIWGGQMARDSRQPRDVGCTRRGLCGPLRRTVDKWRAEGARQPRSKPNLQRRPGDPRQAQAGEPTTTEQGQTKDSSVMSPMPSEARARAEERRGIHQPGQPCDTFAYCVSVSARKDSAAARPNSNENACGPGTLGMPLPQSC